MSKRAKVAALMRIKEAGSRPYMKPVWNGNKLKPHIGIIHGKEMHRPEASYYLRFTHKGKNCLEPTGRDPVEVRTLRERRLAILTAQAAGLDVAAEPETPSRITIHAAIAAYLDRLQRDKRHAPTIRSKRFELGEFAKFCRDALWTN